MSKLSIAVRNVKHLNKVRAKLEAKGYRLWHNHGVFVPQDITHIIVYDDKDYQLAAHAGHRTEVIVNTFKEAKKYL